MLSQCCVDRLPKKPTDTGAHDHILSVNTNEHNLIIK